MTVILTTRDQYRHENDTLVRTSQEDRYRPGKETSEEPAYGYLDLRLPAHLAFFFFFLDPDCCTSLGCH